MDKLLQRLNNSMLVRFLLLVASGWALLQMLAYFEIVIVIFVISGILAFLLSYPVQWCRRWLPHGPAVFTVFIVALIVISSAVITLALAVIAQGQSLVDNSTDLLGSLLPAIEQIEQLLEQWNLSVNL